MDMRDYISQRLNAMQSVEEKNILRECMEKIFIPLYDHVENEYTTIERRVRDEIALDISLFTIWTTIMPREKADGGCPYLFPIDENDLRRRTPDLSEIQSGLKSGNEINVGTVFLEADYIDCKQLGSNREVFSGKLLSDGREYSIGVRLRPTKKYQSRIESLYKLFISNAVPWQTINAPYLFKMFDVYVVRLDSAAPQSGAVENIAVDYGSYASKMQEGFIPVWNIQKRRIQSEDFPLAAIDKINYEYHFDLQKYGEKHGYLADYESADIASVQRENSMFVVTSPSSKGLVWDMYQITKKEDYTTDQFDYILAGNEQQDSFAGRMISSYGVMIKTKGELLRLLSSYAASEYVQLDSFEVVSGLTAGETYEVNTFLSDEVRDISISKTMLLRFKPLKRNHFITRDEMSFLTSQVQLVYPEFNCVGVLI